MFRDLAVPEIVGFVVFFFRRLRVPTSFLAASFNISTSSSCVVGFLISCSDIFNQHEVFMFNAVYKTVGILEEALA
jgi:hypothetical protein